MYFKPINFIHTENDITFVYTTSKINIFVLVEGKHKFVTELNRANSIKPAFINKTDFILFATASVDEHPLYFKFIDSEYKIIKLNVDDKGTVYKSESYINDLKYIAVYSDRYKKNTITARITQDAVNTETLTQYNTSNTSTKSQLCICFKPDYFQILSEPDYHDDIYVMSASAYTLTFDCSDIDNGNIEWLIDDFYD